MMPFTIDPGDLRPVDIDMRVPFTVSMRCTRAIRRKPEIGRLNVEVPTCHRIGCQRDGKIRRVRPWRNDQSVSMNMGMFRVLENGHLRPDPVGSTKHKADGAAEAQTDQEDSKPTQHGHSMRVS